MRNHLINELTAIAKKDKDVMLIAGDLGFGVLNEFMETLPDQFINAGICEQNMASVAAGLALEGKKVYVYSIGNFPGIRCLEQVRNDICYHNANVKIIVVGGGFAYGQLGMSHHATEDLSIMRSLPNMTVYSPSDPLEAVDVIREAYATEGPGYIRLGKGGENELYDHEIQKGFQPVITLQEGEKVALLATGSLLEEAKTACEQLAEEGVHAGLYDFVSVKPLSEEKVRDIAKKYQVIVTIEEHTIVGGFGGAVCEVVAGMSGERASVIRIGLQDEYTTIVGSQRFLREYYHMVAEDIVNKVRAIVG